MRAAPLSRLWNRSPVLGRQGPGQAGVGPTEPHGGLWGGPQPPAACTIWALATFWTLERVDMRKCPFQKKNRHSKKCTQYKMGKNNPKIGKSQKKTKKKQKMHGNILKKTRKNVEKGHFENPKETYLLLSCAKFWQSNQRTLPTPSHHLWGLKTFGLKPITS